MGLRPKFTERGSGKPNNANKDSPRRKREHQLIYSALFKIYQISFNRIKADALFLNLLSKDKDFPNIILLNTLLCIYHILKNQPPLFYECRYKEFFYLD